MLDSDASFFLVPEFQSSRGARRCSRAPSSNLRFGAHHGADLAFALMPHHGTQGTAAPAAISLFSASPVPDAAQPAENTSEFPLQPAQQGESQPEFTTHLPSDSLFAPDDETQDDWTAGITDGQACAGPGIDSPDARAVTPRRPMRFTFAREATEHARLTLPVQNLFDGVFDEDALTGPDVDPRLARSRARARARLAAHEASLAPEARNLWCDDGSEIEALLADQPQDAPALTVTETPASDGSDGTAPRRAVRHLTVNRRAPRPQRDPSAIHDPLQDHLHLVRDALYAPDPGIAAEPAAMATTPPLYMRLLAMLLAFTVTHVLLPLRAAGARLATVRSTLSQQARALTANLSTGNLLSGILHPPMRGTAITTVILVLAQTVPPHLM